MTIQATFESGGERIIIRIIGNNVLFIDSHNQISPIEGLNFKKEGCIQEHPDLKDDPEWKQKTIQRFVDKIKSFESETQKINWLINEMKEKGYTPLYLQRQGHRPQKIKQGEN